VKILFYLSSFLILCSFKSIGQTKYGLEFGSRLGVLIHHRPIMKHLPQENIFGFDFSVYKVTTGLKKWHLTYKNPKIGLTVYHSNLGNQMVLGNCSGLTSWLEFPFIKTQNHTFSLNLRLGLAHVSKPFDLNTNPTNIALASNFNCLAIGGLQYLFSWNKFSYGLRAELTHLSNAALEAPNLGLNMIQASFSVGYHFSKNKMNLELYHSSKEKKDTSKTKRDYLYFLGFIGQKQLFNYLNENFKVVAGTLAYQHVFSLPVGLEVGFDMMNNQADIKLLAEKEIYVNRNLKTGAYVAYVLTLDKLHFLVAMGHYLHDPYNLNDKFYHRVGLRYTFLNRFVLNSSLKTHWGNADYLEIGIGMRFG
jgi:hypothetical protein